MPYYKPSGKFSYAAVVYFGLMCIAILPLLALVYSYAIWYIPFVYLNFIVAAAFGLLTGLALGYVVIDKGKVRNSGMGILLGLAGGAVALYLHWAIWLDLVINSGESYGSSRIRITLSNISLPETLALILSPSAMFELIGLVNESGTWSIRRRTVSGWMLSAVWVIEAVVVLAMSTFMAWTRAKRPFSETTGKWTEEKELAPLEFISDETAFKAALAQGNFAALSTLRRADSPAKEAHSIFTLFHSDADECYLSVTNKTPEVSDKGETSFKDNEFIEYLTLDAASGKMLMKFAERSQ